MYCSRMRRCARESRQSNTTSRLMKVLLDLLMILDMRTDGDMARSQYDVT